MQQPRRHLTSSARIAGLSWLLLSFSAAAGCSGSAGSVSDGGGGSGGSGGGSGGSGGTGGGAARWAGDPCALLTSADFTTLTPLMTIASSESHNVGSAMFSPECHFSMQGDGISAAVGLYIDLATEFELQKGLFEGTAATGLGKSAWRGDAGGRGNSTVGVLLDKWSFRVDATYEYDYDDLTILAAALATRVK